MHSWLFIIIYTSVVKELMTYFSVIVIRSVWLD
jgi:hypothetical protein